MIWMIVCAVLASAGLLFIVWALLGWCVLPYLVPDAVKLAMAVPLILKGRKHVRS